jgi:hypothetical protein
MEQFLIIFGAAIFAVLGLVHLLYTFFTKNFDAYDPSVTDAIKSTTPMLTKETTVWSAWIGFNASHSLGAMLFAGIYIPLGVSHIDIIQQSVWFSMLPVMIGLSYLTLAKLYWFKMPFTGILISTVCFIWAALLINL